MSTSQNKGTLETALKDVVMGLPIAAGVYDIDVDPKIVYLVNPLFTNLFGYELADIPTVATWSALAYPNEAYRFKLYEDWDLDVARAKETGGTVANREVEITTKTGQILNVLVGARVVDRFVISTFVDISAQRQTEAELENVRFNLERTAYELTENLPVGTYTMVQPAEGGLAQFRFMSPRFLEICGLKRDDAYADPLNAFACIHPDDYDRWLELNTQAFNRKEAFFGETRVVANGITRWITAQSKPRPLPDGSTVWEGVLTDITDRKMAEQALARAKTRAEELERLKGDFLTQMSHEIRTPLTAILGVADLLAQETLKVPQLEKVTQIQTSGKLLLGIINDILDMSKIEAGQLITEELPFEIEDLLTHLQTFQTAITKPNLRLYIVQAQQTFPRLIGDKRRIEQVLTNLVGNAIKFTDEGQITVTIESLDQSEEQMSLRISVADTGRGIEQGLLPNLFRPFIQADTGISREYGGTGLGLSISKQLVELMGGRISVHSEINKGSTFWFELPITVAPHGNKTTSLQAHQQSVKDGPNQRRLKAQLTGLKILVVDDSDAIRHLICEFLEREQAIVSLAQNGAEALELLKSKTFDCVMMDVQMPVMDGLTATRHIRALPECNKLPVLAMTAGLLAEQQARARQAGMTDVVAKPVDFTQMVRQILAAVGRVSATPTHRSSDNNPMPDIPGINRDHVNRTMESDHRLFERLCVVFIEEFEGLDDRIHAVLAQELNAETMKEAGRLAHALRGAAGQIGALDLCQAAAAVEQALLKDTHHSPVKLATMGTLLADLIAALKGHLRRV